MNLPSAVADIELHAAHDYLVSQGVDESKLFVLSQVRPEVVSNLLARAAGKHKSRRFTGEPITGFGSL